jgi:hypothetical protein
MVDDQQSWCYGDEGDEPPCEIEKGSVKCLCCPHNQNGKCMKEKGEKDVDS